MIAAVAVWTGLLIVIVAVTSLGQRFRVPVPLLLVLTGLVLSAVPGLPQVALNPDLVLDAVLPLLVYTSAVVIPWHEFRRNLRPIGLLSVGLVLFTTFGVALLARTLVPGMSWIAALVLGAIVSPPDDVAATAVTERLPVPRRLVIILEGEGLLNDATALTVFRFALIGAAGGAMSFWQAPLFLFGTLVGGVAYGLAVGWLALKLRERVRDTTLEITLSLITPFAAYLVPEWLGMTGIPAVVAAGLVVSAQSPRLIPAATRVQVHSLWRIVSFWLNSALFLLLGLQLPRVAGEIVGMSLTEMVRDGLLFSLLVIALRFAWVYPAAYLSRWLVPSIQRRDPLPPARHLFMIAYTGMRGAISLAAALAIPAALPSGEPFPARHLIIFVTFFVILATLLGQGLGLPYLIRRLGIDRDGLREREQESRRVLEVRAAAVKAGLARLADLKRDPAVPAELIEPLRQEREYYLHELHHHMGGRCDEVLRRLARVDWDVHRTELAAEREALLAMLREGHITDQILVQVEHDLDLREMRLQEHAFFNAPLPEAAAESAPATPARDGRADRDPG